MKEKCARTLPPPPSPPPSPPLPPCPQRLLGSRRGGGAPLSGGPGTGNLIQAPTPPNPTLHLLPLLLFAASWCQVSGGPSSMKTKYLEAPPRVSEPPSHDSPQPPPISPSSFQTRFVAPSGDNKHKREFLTFQNSLLPKTAGRSCLPPQQTCMPENSYTDLTGLWCRPPSPAPSTRKFKEDCQHSGVY